LAHLQEIVVEHQPAQRSKVDHRRREGLEQLPGQVELRRALAHRHHPQLPHLPAAAALARRPCSPPRSNAPHAKAAAPRTRLRGRGGLLGVAPILQPSDACRFRASRSRADLTVASRSRGAAPRRAAVYHGPAFIAAVRCCCGCFACAWPGCGPHAQRQAPDR
jgi:hypothetical protein